VDGSVCTNTLLLADSLHPETTDLAYINVARMKRLDRYFIVARNSAFVKFFKLKILDE